MGAFPGKALSTLLMDVEASSCGILDSDTGQNPPLGCRSSQHPKARTLGSTPPGQPTPQMCRRAVAGRWLWGLGAHHSAARLRSEIHSGDFRARQKSIQNF